MHWRSALWVQPGCLLRHFDDDHFQQPYRCVYYRPDEEGLVDLHTGAGSVDRNTRTLKMASHFSAFTDHGTSTPASWLRSSHGNTQSSSTPAYSSLESLFRRLQSQQVPAPFLGADLLLGEHLRIVVDVLLADRLLKVWQSVLSQ